MKYLYFKDKELKVKSKIQDNELDDYYDQMLIMNGDYNTQTPDHKDTVYYESGDEELREAVEEVIGVEAKEEIAWTDKPTEENTKDEIKAWMDSNDCEYNSGDTKQDLLDKIPELKQEAVEAVDAVDAIEAISIGDVKEEGYDSVREKTYDEIISEQDYKAKRKAEYPSTGDQLDQIYHEGLDAWKDTIKLVKDKYPK